MIDYFSHRAYEIIEKINDQRTIRTRQMFSFFVSHSFEYNYTYHYTTLNIVTAYLTQLTRGILYSNLS